MFPSLWEGLGEGLSDVWFFDLEGSVNLGLNEAVRNLAQYFNSIVQHVLILKS
jgi:hypothetical protein